MLTVVFGAGASYDSIPHLPPSVTHPWRPPRADELWDARFDSVRARWRQADEIVPIIRGHALGSVEETLASLAEEAVAYPRRQSQVEAVRSYLHFLLWSVGRHWGEQAQGLTNYLTLLDELDRIAPLDEPVCLVTFNYDRFLDDALIRRGVNLGSIDRYTTDARFKLFKVHGSADWAAEVDIEIPGIDEMNVWGAAEALIARATWPVSDRWHKVTDWPIGKVDGRPAAPVLALPMTGKDRLSLPRADEELLKELLPRTTNLLVLGWKGEDPVFAELLRSKLPPVRGMIVSGNHPAAIVDRLRLTGDLEPVEGGFTTFVHERGARRLYGLSTPSAPGTPSS
jgi:hypothetical protein